MRFGANIVLIVAQLKTMNKHTNIENKEDIRGKTVVVTGASGGAGRAIAVEFARYGARLVLAGRRDFALEEVVEECNQNGAQAAICVVTDVTDAEAVVVLAKTAFEVYDKIDVWVNNAGVLSAGSFTDTPVDVIDQVIRTNLMGYIHGAHAVLPYFKEQGYGVLINNISVGGWFPVPYATGYSASKFGLRGFSEALRGELIQWPGIHVCDAFPAFLDTPGIRHAANFTGRYLKPAPPVYDPKDLAEAIVHLARHPRPSVTVGSMSTFLRLSHFLFPSLSRGITAKVIERYLKVADEVPLTNGNLFRPLKFGSGVYGGWSRFTPPSRKKIALSLLLVGGAALLLSQRSGLLRRSGS